MTKNRCLDAINSAIDILEEMKGFLGENQDEDDVALAFLEAGHDAQEQINRAILEALTPIITST